MMHLQFVQDEAFTSRAERTMSQSLTLQYDNILFMIEPSEFARAAIGQRVEVVGNRPPSLTVHDHVACRGVESRALQRIFDDGGRRWTRRLMRLGLDPTGDRSWSWRRLQPPGRFLRRRRRQLGRGARAPTSF